MIRMKSVIMEGPFGIPIPARIAMGDAGAPVKKPVRVFRLEMPNGNGPYNSGLPDERDIYLKLCLPDECGGFDCARLARECGEQMGITEKEFLDAHGHANYGCLKVEDIYAWFSDNARRYLSKYDAKIVEYEIPVGGHLLKVHDKEVIFNRHECRKVAEYDIMKGEKIGR